MTAIYSRFSFLKPKYNQFFKHALKPLTKSKLIPLAGQRTNKLRDMC